MIVSNAAVTKSATGNTFTPASISLAAQSQTGTANPVSYSGRFKIETTTNGTSWTTQYTSSANESAKNWTIPTNIDGLKAIRCTLYKAGGTSTLHDQQSIVIVSNGADGTDGAKGDKGY